MKKFCEVPQCQFHKELIPDEQNQLSITEVGSGKRRTIWRNKVVYVGHVLYICDDCSKAKNVEERLGEAAIARHQSA